MFLTNRSNQSKEKKSKPDRLKYLDQLVVEFQKTENKGESICKTLKPHRLTKLLLIIFCFVISDAKEQILANLANFAYDPFNYNFFRLLGIIDLFLDHLVDENENLIKYAIGGLCNLSLGKKLCILFFVHNMFHRFKQNELGYLFPVHFFVTYVYEV